MTKDEALKLALEALECFDYPAHDDDVNKIQAAITAIKQARSAPVQEPVWIQPDHLQKAQKAPFLCRVEPNKRDDFAPLYYTTPPAAQRQWVGLSEQEVWDAVRDTVGIMPSKAFRVYQAIETVLKEKNT